MVYPILITRVFLLLLTISGVFATDYYVSPSGNDTNSGTSPLSAWKTPAKVNGRSFAAGDRILFEGGQTFSGGLSFGADDNGTAAAPITVSTYGSGRAVLNAGAASGLFAYNTAGLSISNLILTGSGAQTNTKGGIDFYNDLAGNVRLGFIRIDNVEASGFRHGIIIGGWNGTSGFNDIRVTNSVAHDNQRSGMSTYAQARYGITNVYVGHCTFYNNFGDPALTTTPSGNGVVLGEVDGALIERTVAYNNGYLCPANNGGPVGIWVYDANNATIQHCEAYGNRTGGATDGGGFDLDINTTNSVMQYNYSHDNDGAGFGLYQGSDPAPWSNNIVRYNVSQNDGRKNSYGGITLWTGGGSFGNGEIYGNTVYVAPAATGTAHAVRINSQSSNFKFRNNILLTAGGLPLLSVVAGQTGLLFQGNDYFTYGGAFKISWIGTTYSSLAAFRTGAGQEQVAGTPTGFSVDPLLVNAGGGPNIGFPDLLESQLTAYQLGITGRRHSILFANGSRVYAFPHRAHSVLGVTADHLIVDEAARVDQKVLAAILPSLARTNGSIWLLSTPACQTGVFYDIWHADNEDKWYKVKATIEDTRYATPEFIADVQSLMPEREFRQDFYCEFHALQGALFTREMVDKLFTYDGDNWVLPPLNKEVGWK